MQSTIIVEVTQEEDGGFIAEGLTENIFTQANTWDELKGNVMEAVKGYYFDQPSIPNVKLHLVKDELLVVKPHPHRDLEFFNSFLRCYNLYLARFVGA